MLALAYAATALGLVPLVVLAVRGESRAAGWWLMAAAFGVSFVADVAGRMGYTAEASQTYPIAQAALFALVLLPSRAAVEAMVAAVLFAGSVSIVARGGVGLDTLLHTTAWGAIAVLGWTQLPAGHLRNALVYGFGGGAVAWCAFAVTPTWWTWGALQGTRLYAVTLFSYAALLTERRRA